MSHAIKTRHTHTQNRSSRSFSPGYTNILKMKNTLLSFTIIFFALFVSTIATGSEVIGNWNTYLSYSNAQHLYFKDSRIFCIASNNLFYIDKTDFDDINNTNNYPALYTTTKKDGLNDIKIKIAEYSKENNTTVIAYTNGNLDLIKEGNITNLPFIKLKDIGTDKAINNITFIDDNAYLSCDFGIVVINLSKMEISATYYLGNEGSYLSVNDLTTDGTYLYAATDDGLKKAAVDDPFLMNPKKWETITNIPGGGGQFTLVSYINNTLFASRNQGGGAYNLYRFSEDKWQYITAGYIINNISFNGEEYLVSYYNRLLIYSSDFKLTKQIQSLQAEDKTFSIACNKATWDTNKNIIWMADNNNGLTKINSSSSIAELFTPEGPVTDDIFRMKLNNGVLKIIPGGRNEEWNNKGTTASVSIFDGTKWFNITNIKSSTITPRDFVNLADDPSNSDHFYVATWNYGLAEFSKKGNEYSLDTIWTNENSTLHNIGNSTTIRVDGMAYDADGNLWITNSESPSSIKILTSDNEWLSLSYSDIDGKISLGEIKIDDNQIKWVQVPRGKGIMAIDDNGTIRDNSDDKSVLLKITNQEGEALSNSVVNTFTFDKTGNLWIGLSEGIAVYYNPEDVFKSTIYASQILIPRNDGTNLADPLLDGEKITAIEVDGGNRKWIGTQSNGAFLVSEDGLTTITHFTAENSPILSNTIIDIEIDQETGLVYFGTSEGLVTYQSDAKKASTLFTNVHAFPNPARLSQINTITISGLVNETFVKITDANGNLVYETISNGGYASWNGNNLRGDRVNTGVYYIFCSSKDGTKSEATKILVIK